MSYQNVMIIVAVAFPKREEDRARVREHAHKLGVPIPALYAGGTERPCETCGMVLDIGPRVEAALLQYPGSAVYCPFCIPDRISEANVQSLGNPDSRPE